MTGRPKHFYSIHTKMREEELSFDQIYDLVAFRIIVGSVRECYEALGVVHASWKPIPGRFKDYIALPKVNMYQSLHTTVIGPRGQRIEVQIRTAEMHEVAEQGIAAHWNYKAGGAAQMRETERFAWLRRLIEWQQNLKDPQEFLSTVKDDLFPEEVFVFTPKGDLLDFPQGATVIDFAYRIHSQVGFHLSGARVNGRMVPLRYRMRSGDTVEVVTSERQTPGKDWANNVVTARAKSRIRQWLRQQQAERSRELGASLLERELEPLGLSVTQLKAKGRFESALKEFSQRDAESLLAAVGYGIVTPAQLIAKLLTPDELKVYRAEKQPAPVSSADGDRVARNGRIADNAVIVSGIGDMMVRFAHCCNPLPGEAITGFITRGRGVTVHMAGCPHALATDPQRRVPVVWKAGDETLRPIRLEVLCVDQPGLLAAMSKAIASAGVNISTAEVKTTGQDGRALSLFELKVSSAGQLNNLMHSDRRDRRRDARLAAWITERSAPPSSRVKVALAGLTLFLIALFALEFDADAAPASLRSDYPRAHLKRRLMANVLGVRAFELGDPVAVVVLMKSDDTAVHLTFRSAPRSRAHRGSGHRGQACARIETAD